MVGCATLLSWAPGCQHARLPTAHSPLWPPHHGLPTPLQKRIELVDSYARVIAMIEIEVEMDADLPAAEVLGESRGGKQGGRMQLASGGLPRLHLLTHPSLPPPSTGIEEQIARLSEIESLQEEWQIQAEAQDEVERLLRSQAI